METDIEKNDAKSYVYLIEGIDEKAHTTLQKNYLDIINTFKKQDRSQNKQYPILEKLKNDYKLDNLSLDRNYYYRISS